MHEESHFLYSQYKKPQWDGTCNIKIPQWIKHEILTAWNKSKIPLRSFTRHAITAGLTGFQVLKIAPTSDNCLYGRIPCLMQWNNQKNPRVCLFSSSMAWGVQDPAWPGAHWLPWSPGLADLGGCVGDCALCGDHAPFPCGAVPAPALGRAFLGRCALGDDPCLLHVCPGHSYSSCFSSFCSVRQTKCCCCWSLSNTFHSHCACMWFYKSE